MTMSAAGNDEEPCYGLSGEVTWMEDHSKGSVTDDDGYVCLFDVRDIQDNPGCVVSIGDRFASFDTVSDDMNARRAVNIYLYDEDNDEDEYYDADEYPWWHEGAGIVTFYDSDRGYGFLYVGQDWELPGAPGESLFFHITKVDPEVPIVMWREYAFEAEWQEDREQWHATWVGDAEWIYPHESGGEAWA